MDPVTAIGLTGALVSIVELGTKLCKRFNEYRTWAGDFPKDIEVLAARLPLLLETIQRVKERFEDSGLLTEVTVSAVKPYIEGFKRQLVLLDAALEGILPDPKTSRWRRTQTALKSFKREKEIKATQLRLTQYEGSLGLYLAARTQAHTNDVPLIPPVQRVLHYDAPNIAVRNFIGRGRLLDQIKTSLDQDRTE